MAEQVGLSRGSFQRKKYPHYDLTEDRRALAVAAGAVETTSREILLKAKFLAAQLEVKMSGDRQQE